MFSLPSGERPVEGTSDANPIVLAGDTAVEFRHFLWTLYALYVSTFLSSHTSTDHSQAF